MGPYAIAVLLAAILFWALVEWAAVAALLGAVSGERIERCTRCGHYGLTQRGRIHATGCRTHLRMHRGRVDGGGLSLHHR